MYPMRPTQLVFAVYLECSRNLGTERLNHKRIRGEASIVIAAKHIAVAWNAYLLLQTSKKSKELSSTILGVNLVHYLVVLLMLVNLQSARRSATHSSFLHALESEQCMDVYRQCYLISIISHSPSRTEDNIMMPSPLTLEFHMNWRNDKYDFVMRFLFSLYVIPHLLNQDEKKNFEKFECHSIL